MVERLQHTHNYILQVLRVYVYHYTIRLYVLYFICVHDYIMLVSATKHVALSQGCVVVRFQHMHMVISIAELRSGRQAGASIVP